MTPSNQAALFARDVGMEAVLDNAGLPWRERAMALFTEFVQTNTNFIGEEFRRWALERGLSEPHHHNAWGALLGTAAKRGMIRMTGSMRRMETERSHARKSPVWSAAAH